MPPLLLGVGSIGGAELLLDGFGDGVCREAVNERLGFGVLAVVVAQSAKWAAFVTRVFLVRVAERREEESFPLKVSFSSKRPLLCHKRRGEGKK